VNLVNITLETDRSLVLKLITASGEMDTMLYLITTKTAANNKGIHLVTETIQLVKFDPLLVTDRLNLWVLIFMI
jgi:hypothetical protein